MSTGWAKKIKKVMCQTTIFKGQACNCDACSYSLTWKNLVRSLFSFIWLWECCAEEDKQLLFL
jgi:hypothetical protein